MTNSKIKRVVMYEQVIAKQAEKRGIQWAQMRERMFYMIRLMNLQRGIPIVTIDLQDGYQHRTMTR